MAIHMLPCPIVPNDVDQIPPSTIQAIHSIDTFVVERAKTARHFIKATNHPIAIQELNIFELDKHDPSLGLEEFLHENIDKNIGVLSEAGCPGVADPGSIIVSWAHRHQVPVKAHIGPSSILMALMASGMNGQSFAFQGYLPHKKPGLTRQLKSLEQLAYRHHQSQIFIEAPYRNQFLLEACMEALNPDTLLSMSVDIGADTEEHICLPVGKWVSVELKKYHKRPAVYVIGIPS